MYIPPTFPFLFYDEILLLSYLFLLSFLLWCLCHNYYKYLAIEEKKRGVWGGSAPSEARASNFTELLGGRNIEREAQEPTSGIQARL